MQRDTDKDALREIVYRAQLTTLSPSHPHATEDRTKPYLTNPVKGFVKDYKGNSNWTYRSQRFSSRGSLNEGLYYGHKSKGYATEVVTTAKKPLPDDKETRSRR